MRKASILSRLNRPMKKDIIMLVLALVSLSSCGSKGTIEGSDTTVQLSYIPWACDCANWITHEDYVRYENSAGDSLAWSCIFLEPDSGVAQIPDSILNIETSIEVQGSFYAGRGFPQGFSSPEPVEAARVFRYSGYKVIVK
jgi:hypothetical protein